jgi:hypothetical protein
MDAKLTLTTLMAQNFDVFYFVDDMLYVLYFRTGQCWMIGSLRISTGRSFVDEANRTSEV